MKSLLYIKNLKIDVEGSLILKNLNLEVNKGEICAIMGPNGSGKSSLAFSIIGHPKYKFVQGTMDFDGKDLRSLSIDKRAKAGIFLAMQHPHEVEGVTVKSFLRYAYDSLYKGTEKALNLSGFKALLQEKMEMLKIKPEFVQRYLNVGFSGGEKKKAEILQMAVLQPKFVILDEIDSGLDIDSLKIVCDSIKKIKKSFPDMAFLIITHYPKILEYLKPDVVHVLKNGAIAKTGNKDLVSYIETHGYE